MLGQPLSCLALCGLTLVGFALLGVSTCLRHLRLDAFGVRCGIQFEVYLASFIDRCDVDLSRSVPNTKSHVRDCEVVAKGTAKSFQQTRASSEEAHENYDLMVRQSDFSEQSAMMTRDSLASEVIQLQELGDARFADVSTSVHGRVEVISSELAAKALSDSSASDVRSLRAELGGYARVSQRVCVCVTQSIGN